MKLSKEDILEKIAQAKKRIEELTEMGKIIEETGEISITDPDARHMGVSNNGTDISHNVQIAVDSKHHLVAAVDVVSSPADQGQLYNISSKAKEELGIEESEKKEPKDDELTVLADKGYYTGEDLEKCEKANMKTIVARQKMPSHNGNEDYSKDNSNIIKKKIHIPALKGTNYFVSVKKVQLLKFIETMLHVKIVPSKTSVQDLNAVEEYLEVSLKKYLSEQTKDTQIIRIYIVKDKCS